MTVKVSELVEVTEWSMPLLVSASGSQVLHIVHKNGKSKPKSVSGYQTRYEITDCGRALDWTAVFDNGTVESWEDNWGGEGKLCPRCGNREKFQVALSEYHRLQEASRQAYNERRAAEDAELERIWNLARDAADWLSVELLAVGESEHSTGRLVDIAPDGYNITAVFEIDGRRHPVRIEVLAEGEKA